MRNIEIAAAPLLPFLPSCAWLPWAAVARDNGKYDKVPTCGSRTNAPETWFTLSSALDFLVGESTVAGIGFTIPPGLIALDFDNCRDFVSGQLTDEAQIEIERMNSFAYVTPSRKGFRVIGRNNPITPIRGGKRHLTLPGGTKVEVFIGPTNHFVTFTHEIINGYDAVRDISTEVLDYFVGLPSTEETTPEEKREPQRGIEAIRAALGQIPNERQSWDEWSHIGMATWRSSGGSQEGREAWVSWSAKHPCHRPDACEERWKHWFRSPPTKLGFGTLYYLARQANPLFVPPFDGAIYMADGERYDPETGELPPRDKPGHDRDKSRPAILSLSELDALPPPKWLIEGLIPEQGMVVPYGPPKSGKTFIILSAGLHIAAGKPWFGREVQQGAVVYIAGEGVGGLSLRLRAMRAKYEIPATVPFWVVPRAVNFRSEPEVASLAKLIRDTIGDVPLRFLVVDTLARAMVGADENLVKEVGPVIAACDWLREEFRCTVATIHHSGKDEGRGARGTSALRGAWDAAFEIKPGQQSVTMTVVDQKEAEGGQVLTFDMVAVPVGLGRTSLVPVLREAGQDTGQEEQPGQMSRPNHVPGGMVRIAYDALEFAISGPQSQMLPDHPDIPPSVRGVSIEVFRRTFYERTATRTADTRKHAFSRATEELLRRQLIGVKDPWVWLS